MKASYEELDDLGGLVNTLRHLAQLPGLGYHSDFLENGATAIEGLMVEVAILQAKLMREREERQLAEASLARALGQLKAANDPAPDGIL